MATIGDLVTRLSADARPMQKGLREARGDVNTFADNITTKVAGVAAAFVSVGAVVQGLRASISAASTLEETMNKFNVVFGESAAVMKTWGDTLASEVGRSQTQIAQFLSQSQDLFVPIGFEPGAAEEMSKQVTQLAIDLASFNEKADADSFRDLQSALTGSSEVMLKYGVIVNEAAVKQELLNQGLDPSKATNQQKVMARLNIIMAGTTAAQGDAIRSSGAFANQMKKLRGNLEDVAASIGSQLLPYATKLVGVTAALAGSVGQWVIHNQELVATLIRVGANLTTIASSIGAVYATLILLPKAISSVAKSLTILQALTGPKGWVALAGGLAVAAGASALVDKAFEGIADQAVETVGANEQVAESINKVQAAIDNVDVQPLKELLPLSRQIIEGLDWNKLEDRLFSFSRDLAQGGFFDQFTTPKEGLNQQLAILEKLRDTYETLGAVPGIELGMEEDLFARIEEDAIEKATGAVSAIQSLEDEVSRLKGTATEAEQALSRMAEAGAPPEMLERIRELQREREKLFKDEQLGREADKVFAATDTPLEKFQQEMQKLQTLFNRGFIDPETFRRAVDQAKGRLEGTFETESASQDPGGLAALRKGSREAFSTIQSAIRGGRDNEAAKTAKFTEQSAKALKAANDTLKKVAENTGQQPEPIVVASLN